MNWETQYACSALQKAGIQVALEEGLTCRGNACLSSSKGEMEQKEVRRAFQSRCRSGIHERTWGRKEAWVAEPQTAVQPWGRLSGGDLEQDHPGAELHIGRRGLPPTRPPLCSVIGWKQPGKSVGSACMPEWIQRWVSSTR